MTQQRRKFMVTGGAGFIGSHIVDLLIEQGHEVIILDDLSSGREQNIHPQAVFQKIDIRIFDEVYTHMTGVSGVFHCAAIVSVQFSLEHPEETRDINVQGTYNILRAAAKQGVKRVVFSSSSAVYGESVGALNEEAPLRPQSPYGIQKLISEYDTRALVMSSKLEAVILRYFNVYGPRQRGDSPYAGVIARFLETASKDQSLTIFGDGSQTRDFIHVKDVARANLIAMEAKVISGEIFNIGSGISTSVKQIAEQISTKVEHVAPRIEPKHSLAEISKARSVLKWSPEILLKEGIHSMYYEK